MNVERVPFYGRPKGAGGGGSGGGGPFLDKKQNFRARKVPFKPSLHVETFS